MPVISYKPPTFRQGDVLLWPSGSELKCDTLLVLSFKETDACSIIDGVNCGTGKVEHIISIASRYLERYKGVKIIWRGQID